MMNCIEQTLGVRLTAWRNDSLSFTRYNAREQLHFTLMRATPRLCLRVDTLECQSFAEQSSSCDSLVTRPPSSSVDLAYLTAYRTPSQLRAL